MLNENIENGTIQGDIGTQGFSNTSTDLEANTPLPPYKKGIWTQIWDTISTGNPNYTKELTEYNIQKEQNKYLNEKKAMLKAGLNPFHMFGGGGTLLNEREQEKEKKEQISPLLLTLLLNTLTTKTPISILPLLNQVNKQTQPKLHNIKTKF